MTASDDFVRRPELDQAIEGIHRELSGLAKTQAETRDEMNDKLDRLLTARISDAREMGQLQEQVTTLQAGITQRGTEIQDVRKRQDAPRDGMIRFAVDISKLLVAGAIGYMAKKGVWWK
jgi:predicted  nucleic acid-binding Zn-ribbon protein